MVRTHRCLTSTVARFSKLDTAELCRMSRACEFKASLRPISKNTPNQMLCGRSHLPQSVLTFLLSPRLAFSTLPHSGIHSRAFTVSPHQQSVFRVIPHLLAFPRRHSIHCVSADDFVREHTVTSTGSGLGNDTFYMPTGRFPVAEFSTPLGGCPAL